MSRYFYTMNLSYRNIQFDNNARQLFNICNESGEI